MLAMQYTFALPDDYDMKSIRERVAQKSDYFDRLEGLYEKAFLMSEKGIAGACENTYAPFYFYIWNHTYAMNDFLVSDSFKAVADAFGRTSVKSWLPLYFSSGKAKFRNPVFATQEILDIPADANLNELRRLEYKLHRQWAEHPHNQSGFIGLNADTWQIVRFALWTAPQEDLSADTKAFEVVHLSAPGINPAYFSSPC
jgi:hypothetical protein